MTNARTLAALLALPVLLAGESRAVPASASPAVEVRVAGVRSAAGQVRVALCPRETFLGQGCAINGAAPARQGTVTVRLPDVPPGTYAAQVFHDEDGSGRLERNLLGVPKQGIGFSRDAPMRFGPPSFDEAAFPVERVGGSTSVTLRYF